MTIADHHLDKREVKMSSEQNVFSTLNKVDVSQYTKKKGKFSYLSWCFAVQELLRVCPSATWEVHIFDCPENLIAKQPYMKTDVGYFVQVTVEVDSIKRTQVHPVLDNRNQSIKEPNSFEINTSIQRCLAKAIALHGLGLYIFAGEDLPEVKKIEPVKMTTTQKKTILEAVNSDESPLSEEERNGTIKWLEAERTKDDANKLINKLSSKMNNVVSLKEIVDGVFGDGTNS